MFSNLKSLILSILWITLHFLVHLTIYTFEELRWNIKRGWIKISSCLPHTRYRELRYLEEVVGSIRQEGKKLPKHIGIVALSNEPLTPFQAFWINTNRVLSKTIRNGIGKRQTPEDTLGTANAIDLPALAKLICWAWFVEIRVISLYDVEGFLKQHDKKLMQLIYEECSQKHWVVNNKQLPHPPSVKFYNLPSTVQARNGYKNGHTNGTTTAVSKEALHVLLFSQDDGKEAIIKSCRAIYSELVESSKLDTSIDEISEKVVDRKLNSILHFQLNSNESEFNTEPNLLLVLGKVMSTIGYLPWHIRLTEIHWVPTLRNLHVLDFTKSLVKFSNCQQRFGK